MRFYGTASGPSVREAMRHGLLGMIATPAAGSPPPPGVDWCAYNACFTGRYPGDDTYLAWLARHRHRVDRCAFATAPDVVGDATATLARSQPMLPRIRALGYPAALVAQDGLEHHIVPWDDFDVLFLGGSTTWKLGRSAAELAAQARNRGVAVHMGRVNSLRRLRHAQVIGCQSVDGTYLAYGPTKNLPTLLRWLATLNDPPPDRSGSNQVTADSAAGDVMANTPPASNTTRKEEEMDDNLSTTTTADHGSPIWTVERIRALGVVTDVPTAASIFGLSRSQAYDLARRGEFPFPVLRFGGRYRVPVAAILTALQLPHPEADQPTTAGDLINGPTRGSINPRGIHRADGAPHQAPDEKET